MKGKVFVAKPFKDQILHDSQRANAGVDLLEQSVARNTLDKLIFDGSFRAEARERVSESKTLDRDSLTGTFFTGEQSDDAVVERLLHYASAPDRSSALSALLYQPV